MAKVKIFTKKNSEGVKASKFVGAYVPTNLHTYLSLYVIVNGTSKTEVVNDLLNEWFQDVSVKQASERDLIKEVVKYVLVPKWEESKTNRIKLESFIIQIKAELHKQGFADSLIANMIKIFRHDTKK